LLGPYSLFRDIEKKVVGLMRDTLLLLDLTSNGFQTTSLLAAKMKRPREPSLRRWLPPGAAFREEGSSGTSPVHVLLDFFFITEEEHQ